MTTPSPLGFVTKDNEFSNVAINNNLSTRTLTLQTLNVTNVNVSNTLTTTNTQTVSNVHNLTVSNTLEVDGQLIFTSPSNQIVFENLKTKASITLECQPSSVLPLTYMVPDVGVNSSFVMADGNQTINGVKTFMSTPVFPAGFSPSLATITLTSPMNQITLNNGAGNIILTGPNTGTNWTYTIPDTGTNSHFVMTDSDQTITGSMTFTAGQNISSIRLTGNSLTFGATANAITIMAAPSGDRTYFLPDVGFSPTQFVLLTQTDAISIPATSNQLILGGTTTTTLNAPAPVSSQTYTIPDVKTNSSFMMLDGAQTAPGVKTFSNGILLPTTGGTATNFQYYEVNTGTVGFTCGAFSGTQTVNYYLVRVGRSVTLVVAPLTSVVGNGSSDKFIVGTITPSSNRFQLTNTIIVGASVLPGNFATGTGVISVGFVQVSNGGGNAIQISVGVNIKDTPDNFLGNASFAGSGSTNVGFFGLSVSWYAPN